MFDGENRSGQYPNWSMHMDERDHTGVHVLWGLAKEARNGLAAWHMDIWMENSESTPDEQETATITLQRAKAAHVYAPHRERLRPFVTRDGKFKAWPWWRTGATATGIREHYV